jgi:tetratricopeptide (TPR) repeat protein
MDSLDAAEPYAREAITLRVAGLGEGHADVAFARSTLGDLQQQRGRYAEAESLFTRALAGRRATLGARHPAVASSLQDLARLAYVRGDTATGLALHLRSAETWAGAGLQRAAVNDLTYAADGAVVLGRLALADSLAGVVLTYDAAAARPTAVARALEVRGRVAAARGDSGAAEAAWHSAYARLGGLPAGDVGRERARIAGRLIALYERRGRTADATAWRAKVGP